MMKGQEMGVVAVTSSPIPACLFYIYHSIVNKDVRISLDGEHSRALLQLGWYLAQYAPEYDKTIVCVCVRESEGLINAEARTPASVSTKRAIRYMDARSRRPSSYVLSILVRERGSRCRGYRITYY